MTMSPGRLPAVPTPPQGEPVAAYATYLEAQHAVDFLSDKEFAVQHVTIVGTDLAMVERVTGRLTYSRVALAGLASGAWFGLFVGLLLSLFAPTESAGIAIIPAIGIGAAFGILFSVISYAFTGGKRDFTSASQIVASTYALLCAAEHAHKARALLVGEGGPGLGRVRAAGPQATAAPEAEARAVRPLSGPTPPGDVPPTQPPAGPGS